MSVPGASQPRANARSVCFIQTSPAMVHMLTGDGPDAMGGAELQMCLLGREMHRRGWRVHYLVGDYGQGESLCTEDGLLVDVAYEAGQHGAIVGTGRSLCRFWRALATVDSDVYITRGLTAQTGVVAAFAQTHNRHSVFWFAKNADALNAVPRLSVLPLQERVPAWYGMRHSDAIICQTHQQLTLLKEYVDRSAVVIRNITPWSSNEHLAGNGGGVLWVGSIQPKKRPDLLLEVAAELPEIKFIMAGGRMRDHDDLHDYTVRVAAELPNVNFTGFVPHMEIAEYFRSADILVSTSDGDQEGFPNVFLQAWSAGLPVVATCDPDGVITEHALGEVCGSKAELVAAIRKMSTDRTRRHDTAMRARAYVLEQHSAERIGNQLEALLDRLLAADASQFEPSGERV